MGQTQTLAREMAEEDDRPTGILLSLRRGLRVLEAIATSNGAATAKWLSQETGIKIGTCYHILRTLEDEGYVVRLPGSRFGLGSRVAFLHDNFRAHLAPPQELLDILSQLHAEVGETTYISGWYGDNIVLQRYLEGVNAVHVRSLEIGYAGFAHARASGKAILAFLPEGRVRAYLATHPLTRRTANTITDADQFIEHLRHTANQGYAVDREEFADGVCCVSAAIFDRSGFPVGAYTISLPANRFEEKVEALAGATKRAAIQASVALGFLGTYPPQSPLLKR
ncbi:MAG: IclR family transcriptional regulator [Anaerolineae bacterium]|nr:IclR family transcriptional regulator [Candidatus Roseilinea sp.]MDW8451281.1 IclR family transcriptional regulator [Anaerolineae bacterium]